MRKMNEIVLPTQRNIKGLFDLFMLGLNQNVFFYNKMWYVYYIETQTVHNISIAK